MGHYPGVFACFVRKVLHQRFVVFSTPWQDVKCSHCLPHERNLQGAELFRRHASSDGRSFKKHWEGFSGTPAKNAKSIEHPSKSYSTCSMEGIARNIVNHSSTQTHTHMRFLFCFRNSENNWPNPAKIHLKSITNSTRTSCSRGSSSGRFDFLNSKDLGWYHLIAVPILTRHKQKMVGCRLCRGNRLTVSFWCLPSNFWDSEVVPVMRKCTPSQLLRTWSMLLSMGQRFHHEVTITNYSLVEFSSPKKQSETPHSFPWKRWVEGRRSFPNFGVVQRPTFRSKIAVLGNV